MASIRKSTHALPGPAHREADFTPERVVIPRLHAMARSRAGTKFSLRVQQPYRAQRGNRSELAPVRSLSLQTLTAFIYTGFIFRRQTHFTQ